MREWRSGAVPPAGGRAGQQPTRSVPEGQAVAAGRWQTGLALPELLDLARPVAMEGDHAARRTVGPDPSPDQPTGEARRVVPRAPRDGARRRPRGEPATGDGAAHLSADPPVSSHDVVRRDAAAQRPAPAGELGLDLRRMKSEEHTSELQSQSNLVCRLL